MGRPGEPRNYKREYEERKKSESNYLKKQVERVQARRELAKEGKVHKGDGKDVDHHRPLDSGGGNSRSNLRVVDAAENRGWRGRTPGMYGKKK